MSHTYAFAPAPVATLAILGTDKLFPVSRIFCVGRNYDEHAREMGHTGEREAPFFFMKPADAIVPVGQPIPYPSESQDVHHEVELVVALDKGGVNLTVVQALDHVFGYAVGIDLTRRDLQAVAKKQSRPWETAKSFAASAPIGPLTLASACGHLSSGEIWLDADGARRQTGDLKDMIWNVPEIVAQLSKYFTLNAGDVIMTGTPAGVGPVQRGMKLTAGIAKLAPIAFEVR
ncbi:fumarylacetoacetate hydrolase family protein [Aestuariivirga litoralis]|uniref:fumarylacetoacetate hydrolase family protein n=1 Tax=Aestuariivirga litoralis TaxID=2650924 RepID=UPI0018C46EF1|nr:fumarylacetoacetate hydrolase family protein [Aestuariivirga litoralis]MBG1232644.1 fumarylacetoacetate hydrolase family protein [Aestuariivirga litoralis]